jgi:hypothetical protein
MRLSAAFRFYLFVKELLQNRQICSDALLLYNMLHSVTLQHRVTFIVTCTVTSNFRKTWRLQEICIGLDLVDNTKHLNQTDEIVNGGNHK